MALVNKTNKTNRYFQNSVDKRTSFKKILNYFLPWYGNQSRRRKALSLNQQYFTEKSTLCHILLMGERLDNYILVQICKKKKIIKLQRLYMNMHVHIQIYGHTQIKSFDNYCQRKIYPSLCHEIYIRIYIYIYIHTRVCVCIINVSAKLRMNEGNCNFGEIS